MTGRDLIIYILQNNLEDTVLFEDGKIPGLMTFSEAAVKLGVGTSSVMAMYVTGMLDGVKIGDVIYLFDNGTISLEKEA